MTRATTGNSPISGFAGQLIIALSRTARTLGDAAADLSELRESDLSAALASELTDVTNREVVEGRSYPLRGFQGVGPFDLAIGGNPPPFLAELKWSTDLKRDKIFEAAWDAIKLALARLEHGVSEAWLITGASAEAWDQSECSDLFEVGEVDVLELWARPLCAPGPNGGLTVGQDLELVVAATCSPMLREF
jgi:hypothetical protein